MSVQIHLSSLHHNNPLCFPSIFFFKNLKTTKKKWKRNRHKTNQPTEAATALHDGNPPFLGRFEKTSPPFFWTELRPLVSKSTAGPPSPEIKAKGFWWFMWFTVINPMFPGWYQWICVRFFTTCNLLLIKHMVVVLVVFSSTLVHFIYLLVSVCRQRFDDHLRSWQSALKQTGHSANPSACTGVSSFKPVTC